MGAVSVGPQVSLAVFTGNASCKNCTYTLPNDTHSVGQNATKFRVVWGEGCGQSEGKPVQWGCVPALNTLKCPSLRLDSSDRLEG